MPSKCYEFKSLGLKTNFETRKYSKIKHSLDRQFEERVKQELQIPLLDVAAPELVAGVSGISEQRIRKLFENAIKLSPCVLFIDEIDCITQNREVSNRDMEQLNKDPKGAKVVVIGATNRLDSLDPAIRRAGRFDKEVCIGIPDKESRYEILQLLCSNLRLSDDVCLREISSYTPGYVGADLLSLIRESALSAVHRIMEQLPSLQEKLNKNNCQCSVIDKSNNVSTEIKENKKHDPIHDKLLRSLSWIRNKLPIKEEYLENVCITKEDFKLSLKRVQPSSKREGFATVPDVTWDDVGSLKDVRQALQMTILYVGSSEKAVRECFQRAKSSNPCVIFFDELDALCPKRSDHTENSAGMRVVNQLLTEMDGVESRSGVFLMAATNRPDIIDPAVLRPGRLDKIIYVGFPNETDRIDILRALTKNGTKPQFHNDVNLVNIAKNPLCDGFTGADLAALVRDASMLALREIIFSSKSDNDFGSVFVTAKHFEQALQNLRPSVSEKKLYENTFIHLEKGCRSRIVKM
ncbi:hypothetical protein PGB90_001161 [Kerria lacca]